MEKDELNKRIIEKVRNAVVISNLESEENMKLNIKKDGFLSRLSKLMKKINVR